MLTCQQVIDFLLDYLEEGLPQPDRDRFEQHLALCPACVAYLQTYEQVIQAEKVAFRETEALPGPVPDELIRAILASRSKT